MFYLILVLSTALFSYLSFTIGPTFKIESLYPSIATFLFSIFNGFFISRQAGRYNEVRNTLSKIDADLSSLYRESLHVSPKMTEVVKEIIATYAYSRKDSWNSYIHSKSSLVADLHQLIELEYNRSDLKPLSKEALNKMLSLTDDLQTNRKVLVALNDEHVTRYQYAIVILLAVILVITLLASDTAGNLIESLIKAVFIVVVGVVVWTLYKFDNLEIFKGTIGQSTAQDVLDILEGKK